MKTAAVAVVSAALCAVVDLLVVPLFTGTLSGNGSVDALAAEQIFRALVIFAIALAFALVTMSAVSVQNGGDARRLVAATGTALLVLVTGFCAAAFSVVMFLVPLLVLAVLFVYAMPAVLIGGRGATEAVLDSCRVASANLRPTLRPVAVMLLGALAGASIGALLGPVSQVGGWLAAGLIQQGSVAYATLAIVRQYASARLE